MNQQKLFEDAPKEEEPEVKQAVSPEIVISATKEDEGDRDHYCKDCKKNFKYSSNDIRPFIYCECKRGYENPNNVKRSKNTKN